MAFSNTEKQACIILGMHRSGTSALASLVASLGAALPERLSPPGPDNPEGYFEPAVLVELHELLLQAGGSVWFDFRSFSVASVPSAICEGLIHQMAEALEKDYGAAPLSLIKDPRMCRFFGLSRQILELCGWQCSAVLAIRHPAEVAASLAVRNQMSANYAGILWARHMIQAEQDSRGLPRAAVSFQELTSDWTGAARKIRALPGQWHTLDPQEVPVKAALRHHRDLSCADIFGPELAPLLEALHEALMRLTQQDDLPARESVDEAARGVLAYSTRLGPALELEFLHLRLHAARTIWQSADPVVDKAAMRDLFERIGRSLAAPAQT